MESEPLEGLFELRKRVGGEDDHRILVAVGLEPLRVEVISMQVADVQIISGTQGGMAAYFVT
ncbi:MAG: hypothetical protein EBR48_04675 [bacterium]|nr:hypothetical protein [Candidatus Aquidulcis frankliniae]